MRTPDRHGKGGRYLLLWCAACLLLTAGGCGKKAPPFLTKTVVPAPLAVVSVVVKEGNFALTFKVPQEKFRLGKEEEEWVLARLLRRKSGERTAFEERAVIREVQGFSFGERRLLKDTAASDSVYDYRVELRKEKSVETASSEVITIRGLDLPGIAGEVTADGREGAVALTWSKPGEEGILFNIYRRRGDDEKPARVNPAEITSTSYTDMRVDKEVEYCYQLEAFRRVGVVESYGKLTAETCARSVDRTAPPPPERVILVFDDKGYSVSWFPVATEDLSGYNVYRAAENGPFEKMNIETVTSTRYRDTDVEKGKTYRYRVTALDNAATSNESSFSSVVEGKVP